MRWTVQRYGQANKPTSIYVELTQENDLPILFKEGNIRLEIPDETGNVVCLVCVYLKGRGIVPETMTRR